jgi:ParB/RepB/Spo0J family partition protein
MKMTTKIRHIPLDKLLAHPDNPNRMSRASFRKLLRHIRQTQRYEPLVVRPHPQRKGFFQIINGHHRWAALRQLGHAKAQAVVWDIDDEHTDILLSTLNRLTGRDQLDRKLAILRRLSARHAPKELAKLLPQTRGQLERLTAAGPLPSMKQSKTYAFAIPMVFYVSEEQQGIIERALAPVVAESEAKTKAAKRAAALAQIARTSVRTTPASPPENGARQ